MEAKPTTPPPAKPVDENSLIKQRREKLDALRGKGIDPFKKKFFELDPTGTVKEPQNCDVVRSALLKWKENPADAAALAATAQLSAADAPAAAAFHGPLADEQQPPDEELSSTHPLARAQDDVAMLQATPSLLDEF
jgi:hypothetical protein